MLQELKIKHFAIIDQIHLSFRPGFNVLTGETGAGKSILLKSLALLMGDRAEADDIRQGEDHAIVEGLFDLAQRTDIENTLKELGIEVSDHQLVVRRIISSSGKGKVYLNGSISTATDLRRLISPMVEVAGANVPLIELTGQHENRNLTSKSYHRDILDQMAGLFAERSEYSQVYKQYQSLQAELQEFEQSNQNRAQRIDFLEFQLEELDSIELAPGDEEKIELEAKRAKSISRLSEGCSTLTEIISESDDSALVRVQVAMQKVSELRRIDATLPDVEKELDQAASALQEASFLLSQYQNGLQDSETSLDSLEEKLNRLRSLQRKYGSTVEEILAVKNQLRLEFERLSAADATLAEFQLKIQKLKLELNSRGESLHEKRLKAAQKFERLVNDELKDLNMKNVSIQMMLEKLSEPQPSGLTSAEIFMRAGSEPARPLSKTASGGELSRILLAIKRIAGKSKFPRTYLFDEVDTGVSGPTAEKVGAKLFEISKGQQVICVTHLPQVASQGTSHFFISKETRGAKVQMSVVELSKSDRVQEIARLISGEKISKTSLAHAKQLLSDVQA